MLIQMLSPCNGPSMNVHPGPRLGTLQFLDGLHDPHPHPLTVHVASGQQLVRAHRGLELRVLAVLVDQQSGRAVDVDFGYHGGHGG